MNRKTISVLAPILAVLAGCDSGIAGQYQDDRGIATYEFNKDGTAVVTVLGATVAASYLIDGENVLVSSPQGTIVLTRREDDLFGPRGLKMTKYKPKEY